MFGFIPTILDFWSLVQKRNGLGLLIFESISNGHIGSDIGISINGPRVLVCRFIADDGP